MQLNVAFLGFGNVGRALADLLLEKEQTLRRDYDLHIRVVGISTGHHGHVIDPDGIFLRTAIDAARFGSGLDGLHQGKTVNDTVQFIDSCPADLFFETIPTNPHDGQPALDLSRQILQKGQHLVSANKGPAVFAFQELRELAAEHNAGYFFESTVMDGAPVLAVGREGLPGAKIKRISGIFNSTTNVILTRMEQDHLDFDEALLEAQRIGVAEADPTLDIDGWDASIKIAILANVLMGANLRPVDVDREGVRHITLQDVLAAEDNNQRIRLICEAVSDDVGGVSARVSPEKVSINSVLAGIKDTTSIVDIETDTLPCLTIIEHNPGPKTTAYGMLADMLNILRGRHVEGLQIVSEE